MPKSPRLVIRVNSQVDFYSKFKNNCYKITWSFETDEWAINRSCNENKSVAQTVFATSNRERKPCCIRGHRDEQPEKAGKKRNGNTYRYCGEWTQREPEPAIQATDPVRKLLNPHFQPEITDWGSIDGWDKRGRGPRFAMTEPTKETSQYSQFTQWVTGGGMSGSG